MKLALAQIKPNPKRDMDKYPLREDKIVALVESIRDTDFWDNLLGRPEGNLIEGIENDELVGYLASLDSAIEDGTGEFLFYVEIAYGHHRLEAAKQAGLEYIDIPVKVIDDDIMLKIMANENRGEWATNMAVILETVRQVRGTIEDSIADHDDYDGYVEMGGTFFDNSKAFANAKTQGVGFRPIHRFLGETWKENDIRFANATLNAIAEGLFAQEQVVAMNSTGMLGAFTSLAKAINIQDSWPEFFKGQLLDDAAKAITDEDSKATVKIVNTAAGFVKQGKDPLRYLDERKKVDFNVVRAIRKLTDDNPEEVDKLIEADGFKGFENLDELLKKVKKSIKKSAESAAGQDAGAGAEGQEDLDAELDAATPEGTEAELPPVPEGETGQEPVGVVAQSIVEAGAVFATYLNSLADRTDELDATAEITEALVQTLESIGASIDTVMSNIETAETVDEG